MKKLLLIALVASAIAQRPGTGDGPHDPYRTDIGIGGRCSTGAAAAIAIAPLIRKK